MSDEEDDAVPLDDEFAAVMLSRRMTNQGSTEDQSSGKSRSGSGKRPGASRTVDADRLRQVFEEPQHQKPKIAVSAEPGATVADPSRETSRAT